MLMSRFFMARLSRKKSPIENSSRLIEIKLLAFLRNSLPCGGSDGAATATRAPMGFMSLRISMTCRGARPQSLRPVMRSRLTGLGNPTGVNSLGSRPFFLVPLLAAFSWFIEIGPEWMGCWPRGDSVMSTLSKAIGSLSGRGRRTSTTRATGSTLGCSTVKNKLCVDIL